MNPIALLNNQYVRYVLLLLIGVTVGALFYPSKRVEEKVSQKYEQQIATLNQTHEKELQESQDNFIKTASEYRSYHDESEQKISSLTTQVSELKSKQKITTYKIVKPDGTIVERSYTENDIDQTTNTVTQVQQEFQQKIDSIEKKWSKIHEDKITEMKKDFDSKEQSYKNTIASLDKSKTVSVNQKQFGLEAGMMNDKDYYAHVTMDLWGPFFIGLQGEIKSQTSDEKQDNRLGLGIGMRF